jgi:hypothetical protein
MPVELNHIIIPRHDKTASSRFLAELLGVGPPRPVSHFMAVETANGVTLDYDDVEEFSVQHCALLVNDAEFDAIFARVTDRVWLISPIRATGCRVRSTGGTAVVASTSPILTATTWRSSPSRRCSARPHKEGGSFTAGCRPGDGSRHRRS